RQDAARRAVAQAGEGPGAGESCTMDSPVVIKRFKTETSSPPAARVAVETPILDLPGARCRAAGAARTQPPAAGGMHGQAELRICQEAAGTREEAQEGGEGAEEAGRPRPRRAGAARHQPAGELSCRPPGTRTPSRPN